MKLITAGHFAYIPFSAISSFQNRYIDAATKD
jgi:hypothetical protein